MSERVELGGRIFVPAKNTTIEHDFWLMGHIRGAGLDNITVREGEAPDEFVLRLLQETINSSRIFLLLGGLLFPDGLAPEAWTPELAEQTAAFLKKLTAPADKAKIQTQVVSALLGFFQTGLLSLMTFPRSSGAASPEAQPGSESAGVTITATGA